MQRKARTRRTESAAGCRCRSPRHTTKDRDARAPQAAESGGGGDDGIATDVAAAVVGRAVVGAAAEVIGRGDSALAIRSPSTRLNCRLPARLRWSSSAKRLGRSSARNGSEGRSWA